MSSPLDLRHVPGLAVAGLVPPKQYPLTSGYWKAADEGRLVIQRCARCGAHRHPPAPVCYRCQSPAWQWDELAGTGSVFTQTWIHTPITEAFTDVVPFNVCVVELDGTEGSPVRLASTVVGVDCGADLIDVCVQAFFADAGDGHKLLLFRPV
jgi:uncharacterized OB-fold protein